jgi:DNA ligase (NAD+)
VCETPTVKPEGSVFTKCPNIACPGRQWQLLKHFASQGAMDIEGLGEKQVAALMDAGLVHTAADFYTLTVQQLAGLDRLAETSARRLVDAIAASRARPFSRVLFAIGLEEVGFVTGRSLARRFRTIEALLGATVEEIQQTPGVGPVMAQRIHAQLADEGVRALIAALHQHGLQLREAGPPPGDGPLAGQAFVLTGTLPDLTREEATERIAAAGGRVTASVSRKTDYVVAGEAPGSKLAKAERLGVSVIDEARLRELLGS